MKRITIHADRAALFSSWVTQDGLEKWFLRSAEFKNAKGMTRNRTEEISAGDSYRWIWFGYDDSTFEEGSILFSNSQDEMHFSFSGGCIVKINIREEAGECICELEQTMTMPDEDQQRYFFIECGLGWTFYLANLKSILEGGIDLRNKNERIQRVINS